MSDCRKQFVTVLFIADPIAGSAQQRKELAMATLQLQAELPAGTKIPVDVIVQPADTHRKWWVAGIAGAVVLALGLGVFLVVHQTDASAINAAATAATARAATDATAIKTAADALVAKTTADAAAAKAKAEAEVAALNAVRDAAAAKAKAETDAFQATRDVAIAKAVAEARQQAADAAAKQQQAFAPATVAPAPKCCAVAPAPAAPVVRQAAPCCTPPRVVAGAPATGKYGQYEAHKGSPRALTNTPCFANGRPGFRGQDESGSWGCVHST